MIQLGVTGGIGSGKSVVCKIFSVMGFPVYEADLRAKWLMQNNVQVRDTIQSEFGNDAYSNGELNARFLASKVFNNQAQLEKLNSIVHPAVSKDYELWKSSISSELVIKEAALLFETGSYEALHKTALVIAPEDIRKERVLQRDPQRTIAEIEGIMERQWPDEKKVALADFVIKNDHSQLVTRQVFEILEQLKIKEPS